MIEIEGEQPMLTWKLRLSASLTALYYPYIKCPLGGIKKSPVKPAIFRFEAVLIGD